MTSENPRTRVVVFRLTEAEYQLLKRTCLGKGGRSMSEFTRTELLTAISGNPETIELRNAFLEVKEELSRLRASVEELAERVSERATMRGRTT